MVRATRRKASLIDPNTKMWSLNEDVYLIENQELPLEEQALTLKCSIDEISERRSILGLIQRARALMKLTEQKC